MSAYISPRHVKILYRMMPGCVDLRGMARMMPELDDRELPGFLQELARRKLKSEQDARLALVVLGALPARLRRHPAALCVLDRAHRRLRGRLAVWAN